jgi:proline dehydrogenase
MEDIDDVIDRFDDLLTDIVELRDEYDKEARDCLISEDYKREEIVKEKADDLNKLIDMYEDDLLKAGKLYKKE